MSDKPITEEQYLKAMQEKERIEKYLEQLTRITRAYIYQEEAERVKNIKKQAIINNSNKYG